MSDTEQQLPPAIYAHVQCIIDLERDAIAKWIRKPKPRRGQVLHGIDQTHREDIAFAIRMGAHNK